MSDWTFADVWETVASVFPDQTALIHGERHTTWADFDRRAGSLACWLRARGVERQARVAQLLYSGPEYLESLYACFKASLIPVNTNYRYASAELAYLWRNAGVSIVVFHARLAERIETLRATGEVDQVHGWLWVDDGSGPCPDWATPYESAVDAARDDSLPSWERSGDDLYLLYTGGTTGLPKGVMWRQDDLFATINASGIVKYPEEGSLDDVRRMLVAPGPAVVPCAPLMHGTGAVFAFNALSAGGSVATLTSHKFHAVEVLDLIRRERVKSIAIVGDAFARPILDTLDAEPERWDISSLRLISSSGVIWSRENKKGLLRHNPRLLLVDTLSSSEAIGFGRSVVSATEADTTATAEFKLSDRSRVITEDGRDITAGSGDIGLLAIRGRGSIGYWGDEVKTAATFRYINGVRYTIPGDWATVEGDGTVRLLGRGSVCINTGGEKVFPEEVESVLQAYPLVADAVVVGIPDPRFGEVVSAAVELRFDVSFDVDDLLKYVRMRIAGYKVPRHVVAVESISRAPNGKADYARIREVVRTRVAERGAVSIVPGGVVPGNVLRSEATA